MFCAKCGTKVPEGAAFCPECGEKIKINKNVNDLTKDPEHSKDLTAEKAMTDNVNGNAAATAYAAVNEMSNSNEPKTKWGERFAGNGNFKEDYQKYMDSYVRKISKFSSVNDLTKKRHGEHWVVWVWFFIFLFYIVLDYVAMESVDELWFSILSWVPFLVFIFWGKRITVSIERSRYIKKPYRDLSGVIQGNVNKDDLIAFMEVSAGALIPGLHDWERTDGLIRAKYRKRYIVVTISFSDVKNRESNTVGQEAYSVWADAAGIFALATQIDCLVKICPVVYGSIQYYLENKEVY